MSLRSILFIAVTTLIFVAITISAEPFVSTYFHATGKSLTISGTVVCATESTSPESDCTNFDRAEIISTIPISIVKFIAIIFNVYDAGSGELIKPLNNQNEFYFSKDSNKIDISYIGRLDIRSYAFDITISYTIIDPKQPISGDYTTSLQLIADTRKTGQHISTQVVSHYQSLITAEAVPVLGVNDPRIFRLSTMLQLEPLHTEPVTSLTIHAIGPWLIKPREMTNPEQRIGCLVNSVEYPTTISAENVLNISFLDHSDSEEYTYGVTFTPDVSIHCPDYVLSQRYPPDSEIPSQAGYLLIDAFSDHQDGTPLFHVWGASIFAEILSYAPNPYLIDGDLYLEPHNNGFAFAKFEILYDDQIVKQDTAPTDLDTISFDTFDLPWTDSIGYRFAPVASSGEFWESQQEQSLSEVHRDRSKRFKYKSDIFGSNHLSSFSFVAHGQYDASKPIPTAQAVAVAGVVASTTTSDKTINVSIPYVSEVHHCNNPVKNGRIDFLHKQTNFHVELIGISVDTKKVTFSFPQNTYRFEGQFADCSLDRKNGGHWDFMSLIVGTDEFGNSYGSLRSLQFKLTDEFALFESMSYRIACSNGVTNVRHRYFIPSRELLTVSLTPIKYERLDDHHHHYQTTLIFTPRENTNIVLIIFIVLTCVVIASILIAVLYFCGFFRYIYRLVTPTVDYSLQNPDRSPYIQVRS